MALTTTITEELTLEGSDCGASASIEQGDVVYYDSKIYRLTAGAYSQVVLYRCTSSGSNSPSLGIRYNYNKVKYARITNLDDSDECTISIKTRTSSSSYFQVIIGSGGSFIINDHSQFMNNTTTPSYQIVEEVSASGPIGSEVDVEVFIGYEAE